MKRILIPTDFSPGSLNACAYALDLFGSTGATYTLVHSYMDPLPGYANLVEMSSVLYVSSVEGLAEFSKRFRTLKGGADALLDTQVVYGPLSTSLMPVCKQRDIDMIVMGTQGATTGSELFGSNAGDLAKMSTVPVLIVPNGARFKGLRNILFADDHVRVEPFAMRPLVKLAEQHAARITIAHVLRNEAEEPDPKVIADYEEAFAQVAHVFTDAQGPDVALALSEVAERDRSDMVAVLHRHAGLLESLFHGSVAKQLAMHTHVPLLVLEH